MQLSRELEAERKMRMDHELKIEVLEQVSDVSVFLIQWTLPKS